VGGSGFLIQLDIFVIFKAIILTSKEQAVFVGSGAETLFREMRILIMIK